MSGVIYAAIVAMWLAFLVPMWLRRHEEAGAEARSVQTFNTAMRVLSRRAAPSEPAEPAPAAAAEAVAPVIARRGGTSPAVRRRRVLLALLIATLAVVALGLWTPVPLAYVALPGALLVLFVGHLIVRGRRRSRTTAAGAYAGQLAGQSTGQSAGQSGRRLDAPTALEVAYDYGSDGAAADDDAPFVRGYDRPPQEVEAAPSGWRPVPVPAPTYVDAPTAPRQVRRIDLSAPGAWTSGRLVSDAVAAAARVAAAEERSHDEERTIEVDLPRARAVGD